MKPEQTEPEQPVEFLQTQRIDLGCVNEYGEDGYTVIQNRYQLNN